jgi:hypothetical protein
MKLYLYAVLALLFRHVTNVHLLQGTGKSTDCDAVDCGIASSKSLMKDGFFSQVWQF